MSIEKIVGNTRVKTIIRKALNRGRFPNSVLFVGPEGTGKKQMALEVAKAINCEKSTDDSCGKCPACLAIEEQEKPYHEDRGRKSRKKPENGVEDIERKRGMFSDVMVISPPKDIIKINQIRLLKQAAYLRPMVGKKRVFIIEEAEKMNTEASNSLLKVLEEPPSFSHILLLTHNPYLILPTLRSRCQVLTFSPISREDIEKKLIERGIKADQARILSLLVRGNLRQAQEMVWDEVQMSRNKAWNMLGSLLGRTPASPFLQSLLSSRDAVKSLLPQILELLSSFLRDLILVKEGGARKSLMNPDYEQELTEVASAVSLAQVLDILERMDYALFALKKNCNVNLLVSSLFSHVMEMRYV